MNTKVNTRGRPSRTGWEFWVDRGGTFTDIVALDPEGRMWTRKLLSEHRERYDDAAIQGIREILGLRPDQDLPPDAIAAVKMGTTVGTNALLERKGAATLLVVNRGYADILRIGYQNRPDLFALHIQRPAPLYVRVVEVAGRIDAAGRELEPIDEEQAAAAFAATRAEGLEAAAIVLMHSWCNPWHELALGRIAREAGFTQVSLSHQVCPAIRFVSRGETTVADAYLSPVVRRHVDRFRAKLTGESFRSSRLLFMQSNGGLVESARFQGKDSVLSGPAAGVIGAIAVCRSAGFERIISFDMGGTSTDVAHYAGTLERVREHSVAGVRLQVPMLQVHTVAAGGGSVLHFDGQRLRVGPDSAGADPGPVSYGRGGPLCVTDANVMVGKLRPEFFPRLFGPEGDRPLCGDEVRRAFARLAKEIARATGRHLSPEAVAEGFLDIAVDHMANAIKTISIQRGHDLEGYTLCCFGGAGGQHACRVAERLGIRDVLLHPLAGVLSAYGMGLADFRTIHQRAIVARLEPGLVERLGEVAAALAEEGRVALRAERVPEQAILAECRVQLRYEGSDTVLETRLDTAEAMRADFGRQHRLRFGFDDPARPLVVEALVVESVGVIHTVDEPELPLESEAKTEPIDRVPVYTGGRFHSTPVFSREALVPGVRLLGPALIIEPTSTIAVEPGWSAAVTSRGHLLLSREGEAARTVAKGTERDPVRLELFNQAFRSIAEQMGYALQNTAHSVNIKERMDFSCALFDASGELIANAPHIPVHLGSMGASVKALIASKGRELRPGEVYLSNSPYHGGTHLPDITVITPVFVAPDPSPLFYLASRGHHADVGGTTPGSMPPNSRTIDEEGVRAHDLKIVADGRFLESSVRLWLAASPWPARNPEANLADLRAQIAANEKGRRELMTLVAQYSLATVQAYMGYVKDNAEAAVRQAIAALRDGAWKVCLDDGSVIRVRVSINRVSRTARIDFTGTSPQSFSNFNAPAAVCKAAVLYVFRTLVQADIPLNDGCLRPLEILLPEGSMLDPRPPAAVVAGNVETSQHIVDALYGALGVMAASQGTMNNLSFGNAHHQYYETICGGAGAGRDFDGCSAVHTHMTNSRITDPEILESRYPVRLEAFAVRSGSGGRGRHRGGDGVIRRIRFLETMHFGILSSRRRVAPFGLAGGEAGAVGCNRVYRADGSQELLAGCAETILAPGDVVQIETPGGGGFGQP
jgi:5-oxoprolinase (ATP-hydrolysing)